MAADPTRLPLHRRFPAVIAEDTTHVRLPADLADLGFLDAARRRQMNADQVFWISRVVELLFRRFKQRLGWSLRHGRLATAC